MSRYIKTFILLFAASLMLPAIAPAKVHPVLKYQEEYQEGNFEKCKDPNTGVIYNCKEKNPSKQDPDVPCKAYNWYDTQQQNAICTSKTLGTKTCYECSCNLQVYQFTEAQCGSTGFQIPSEAGCKLGDQPMRYKTCPCSGTFLPSSSFAASVTSNFSYNGKKAEIIGANNTKLICYDYTQFTCKSGSLLYKNQVGSVSGSVTAAKFTANDDNPFLTYTGKAILNELNDSKNMFCTTSVTVSSPLYTSTARPTGTNDCAEYKSGSAKYSPHTAYGYFNGNCTEGGKCVNSSSTSDCVILAGDSVNTYVEAGKKKGSVTCKYTQGCEEKVMGAGGKTFLCAQNTLNPNGSYFAYTSVTLGSITCKKINGCASPYQQKYLANGTPGDYSKDANYTYDVQKVTSGTGNLVCANPNGCRMDLGSYDYACPTGCWQGYLSYWAKAAGK